MIGVAISLYDKFDDLAILAEILRENFEENYFISVCCNHPDGKEEIEKRNIDIDVYTQGADIEYVPTDDRKEKKAHLHSRILDTFQKSCKGTLEGDTEYILHLHADAWPLTEEGMHKVIDKMESNDKKVAARGKGFGLRSKNFWAGHVMDQFTFFDREFAEETEFFEFEPLDMMPIAGVHTALPILLIGRVGVSNVLLYDDMTEDLYYNKETFLRPTACPRPSIFVPEYDFLHVHQQGYPDSYGEKIQAHYLREFDLKNGENISNLLKEHTETLEDIQPELESMEKKYDKKLKRAGFNPDKFGHQIERKKDVLPDTRKDFVKTLARNYTRRFYNRFNQMLFSFGLIRDNRFSGDPRSRYIHSDASWPEKTEAEVYQEKVDKEKFPDGTDFWFEEIWNE